MESSVKIRGLLIAGVVTGCAAVLCAAQVGDRHPASPPAAAQYVATKTFEVISVRESRPDTTKWFTVGGGFAGNTGALRLTNNRIEDLIARAYGASGHQIAKLPDWTNRPMYDVEAKCDEETEKALASLPADRLALERQHMIQGLLADRFNLKAHWETHERVILHLVVAKNGPKMAAGGARPPSADELTAFGDKKIPEIHQHGDGVLGYEFIGHEAHMAQLAETLGAMVGTDVDDATGLTGTYDFDLRYSQADDARREADPKIWPPIPEAIEEQLGLKLVRATGEVKTLVIDHVERPSAN